MVRAAVKEYDPAALEKRIREHWAKVDAYHATRRHRASGPEWYFIDGPPYATGHIHIGTARNKILKDAVVRHQSMLGKHVRDQPGFDTHGLPIEVKVEKELGFGNKKEIEAHGIDRFVAACKKFATDYVAIMTDEFKELAVWMDWDRPYLTFTNDYIEGAWWAIARAYERHLLFESERVLTWCWRCETPLANAEVEFEERKDPSVYVKFPIERGSGAKIGLGSGEREYLVIWTTTPWTLPANVAVAVNEKITYARVAARRGHHEDVLVVAESQADNVVRAGRYDNFAILSTFPGNELEGVRYHHPFEDEVPYHRAAKSDWNNRVILGDHVAADRTGLVHTATGHGVEDFTVGKQYGIAPFSPVGEDGRYTADAGVLFGLRVKGASGDEESADERVLALLESKGLLLSRGEEKHSYGHCWRCKNPIVYRATQQWFIDVGAIQDQMAAEVERVAWTPEWAGSARQMDWVKNARDWCISRQRYWGIPLPVWKCGSCGETRVIGSREELAKSATDYRDGMDLHRPWIDNVHVACPRCSARMDRVPDVLDVWFDSAVASWAELGFPSGKAEFEKWFPCDWICEGLDQTRGWFYSQLGAGVAALGRVPYESVLMHGWVHDAEGRPMSKSLGNIIQPSEVIAKHGVDALRFHILSTAAPWDDVPFGWQGVENTKRSLNILWNTHVFATQYMSLDSFVPGPDDARGERIEDKWLHARLASLVESVTAAMNAYEIHRAARELERFWLDDLSRWYVRLVRERTWGEADAPEKRAAYRTLYDALLTTSRLLAPFAPLIADAIYQDLAGPPAHATVHMEDWPRSDAASRDATLERDMAAVRDIVEAVANARQKANMKLRWPVRKVSVAGTPLVGGAIRRLEPIVLAQTNAKRIEFVGHAWEGLALAAEPVKSKIGPAFKAEGGKVSGLIREADAKKLQADLAQHGTARVGAFELTPDMVAFNATLPANVLGAAFTGGSAYIDATVDDAIRAEGTARDLVRRIQETRKEAGLAVDDFVEVEVAVSAETAKLVAREREAIAEAVRGTRLAFVERPTGEFRRTWDLEGEEVVIAVTRTTGAKPAPRKAAPAKKSKPVARRPGRAKPSKRAKPAKKPKAARSPKRKGPAKRAAKRDRKK